MANETKINLKVITIEDLIRAIDKYAEPWNIKSGQTENFNYYFLKDHRNNPSGGFDQTQFYLFTMKLKPQPCDATRYLLPDNLEFTGKYHTYGSGCRSTGRRLDSWDINLLKDDRIKLNITASDLLYDIDYFYEGIIDLNTNELKLNAEFKNRNGKRLESPFGESCEETFRLIKPWFQT